MMTAAYSQQAMRTLLALDRARRLQAVEAVEALAEQAGASEATDAGENPSGDADTSEHETSELEASEQETSELETSGQDAPDTPGADTSPNDTDTDTDTDTKQSGTEDATQTNQTEISADQPDDAEPQDDAAAADKNVATPGNGIDMMPFGGNGEMHLVRYGETGDLVVVIKQGTITVMALIDVMQGIKKGVEDDE